MKNAINYYYNLIVENIHQVGEIYYFNYDNNRYYLVLYKDDPKKLENIFILHKNILDSGIYTHQIILNKNNDIATIVNNKMYILIKTQYNDEKVDYYRILSFFNLRINRNNKKTIENQNWAILWEEKNDYLEYLMSQIGEKYPQLRESFSYYIGLGETSIQLANTIIMDNIPKIVAHKRIKSDDTLFEIYNPLNFIIDSRVRDIAEYFKSAFFNNEDIDNDLKNFLANKVLTKEEHILFFARMLYPTYYFDLFEDIISEKKNEKEIKKITKLLNNYEILLKKIYLYYKKTIRIIPIEWLEN